MGDSTEIHVLPELIGYICFRSNVIKSSRGVVIYVKDLISAEQRNDLTLLYEYRVLIERYFCGREQVDKLTPTKISRDRREFIQYSTCIMVTN